MSAGNPINNAAFHFTPVFSRQIPKEGSKALTLTFDFTTLQSYSVDIRQIQAQGKISMVQSLFVDNTKNNEPVLIVPSDTLQSVSVPSGFQGAYPILATANSLFTVSTIGSGKTNISFCNFYVEGFQWSGLVAPAAVLNPQPVSDAILDATVSGGRILVTTQSGFPNQTDHSSSIVTGNVAVVAAPANAARNGFLLQNMDETILEGLYYSLTGTAAIGVPGTFGLSPSGGIGFPGGSAQGVGQGAISIISLSAGHKFSLVTW